MEQQNTIPIEFAEKFRKDFQSLCSEIGKMIVGYEEIVENAVVALFAGGHILLEGVPGLGKTMLVRTMSSVLDLPFSRIQFTPDLMPADIIGTNLLDIDEHGKRSFRFQPGPIFSNLILADEINRATPKTQSALLECMQEKSITVAGVSAKLEEPFFVMATQNPLEMEGTYPLPEAQLDRFLFKLLVPYPGLESLEEILRRTTENITITPQKILNREMIVSYSKLVREVYIAPHVRNYACRLVLATHPNTRYATAKVQQYIRYGASPRGAQGLILAGKIKALIRGRYNVSFDDIKEAVFVTLRHRILLNFEGEAERITADNVLAEILDKVKQSES
ncbi:MAG: MoxR family ATPase [Candidatus Brocadiae bacterium]|nr:MoxR family ATPase [Candidatus Brocadiia bacterium]